MKKFTFQCKQPNGITFVYRSGFFTCKSEARICMNEYKKVFTPCKDWKVIEL